jgi:hypothetical protein
MGERSQCCFCGENIKAEPPDLASLRYTTCFDRPGPTQVDQTIFCHTTCLGGKLHPSVQLYALDVFRMRETEQTNKNGEPKLPK